MKNIENNLLMKGFGILLASFLIGGQGITKKPEKTDKKRVTIKDRDKDKIVDFIKIKRNESEVVFNDRDQDKNFDELVYKKQKEKKTYNIEGSKKYREILDNTQFEGEKPSHYLVFGKFPGNYKEIEEEFDVKTYRKNFGQDYLGGHIKIKGKGKNGYPKKYSSNQMLERNTIESIFNDKNQDGNYEERKLTIYNNSGEIIQRMSPKNKSARKSVRPFKGKSEGIYAISSKGNIFYKIK